MDIPEEISTHFERKVTTDLLFRHLGNATPYLDSARMNPELIIKDDKFHYTIKESDIGITLQELSYHL